VDYKKKEEILLKQVERIQKHFPPALWRAQVELMYDNIQVLPTPAVPQRAAHQPLRPNAAGGGKPKPKSMLDAINQGLNYPAA
jgi:hypothetical protein